MAPESVLIEEEEGYRYWLKNHVGGESKWYTNSPWLLEKLPMLNEHVISLENYVSQEEINDLGVFCIQLSKGISDYLETSARGDTSTTSIRIPFLYYLRRTLFPLFYKCVILDRWIHEVSSSGAKGVIVGARGRNRSEGNASLGRFDNLYAKLAKFINLPGNIRVTEFERQNDDDSLVKRINGVGQSRQERVLSLMNSNLPVWAHRLWKRLLNAREMQLPVIRKKRMSVIIIDECELLEESFLFLLIRGCKVLKLGIPETGERGESNGIDAGLRYEIIEELFHKCFKKRSTACKWLGAGTLSPVVSLIYPMLVEKFTRVINLMTWVKRDFLKNKGVKGLAHDNNLSVATSGLSHPERMVMSSSLQNLGIPVFTFEHGLTYGLSIMTDYWLDRDSMCVGDGRICYTNIAEQFHRKCCNGRGEGVVAGMPAVNKGLKRKAIQKVIVSKVLKISLKKRVIVYIANLYSNNFIYSPGCCSDTWYHELKRRVVFDILGHTDANCVIKLYPTYRYRDPDPFGELMDLPFNVKPVQFIEFRYLRAIGDIAICDSPQSTLGWVWSARTPLIFLDLPSNPLLPDVAEAFDKAIFRIDCSIKGWEEEAKQLLLKPHRELMVLWNAKEGDRKKVEEEYIFGPPGNAGKRAAKFIIEETKQWYENNRVEV